MRAAVVSALACAACQFHNGSAADLGGDGSPGVEPADARVIDARMIDARVIDALPIDAPPDAPPTVPMIVQANTTMQSGGPSIACTFASAQLANHFDLVAIAWFGSPSVSTVTDTAGNTYTHVGEDSQGSLHQDYFYVAATAAAATNTVTATFSSSVSGSFDIRIVEYSGIMTTGSVDTSLMAVGASGTALDSGAATTAHAHDLLVGIGTDSSSGATPGSGFSQDMIAWGDLVEHQEVNATGGYHATMTQSGSSGWIMRVLALAVAP